MVRRLFSTFAGGLPGAGLVVMRLAASIVLAAWSLVDVPGAPAMASAALPALQVILAILLLAGLWTPVAGLLTALIEVARLLSQADDPWVHLLLAAVGLALALVGPGSWSIDARLFGWRRIDLRDRPSRTHTPKG
jgi:putative oxidoreductase